MNTRTSLLRNTTAMAALVGLTAAPYATQVARSSARRVREPIRESLPAGSAQVTISKLVAAAGPLDALARKEHYMIVLDARSKRSGEQSAQATCVASRRGDVIVLDSDMTSEYVAKADFRATFVR